MARIRPKKQATQQLRNFLTAIASEELISFDKAAAELAGRIAGELERIGQPIGLADPMIAAIALTHGLELVTGNTAHFQRVQQLGYPLTYDLEPGAEEAGEPEVVVLAIGLKTRNRIWIGGEEQEL